MAKHSHNDDLPPLQTSSSTTVSPVKFSRPQNATVPDTNLVVPPAAASQIVCQAPSDPATAMFPFTFTSTAPSISVAPSHIDVSSTLSPLFDGLHVGNVEFTPTMGKGKAVDVSKKKGRARKAPNQDTKTATNSPSIPLTQPASNTSTRKASKRKRDDDNRDTTSAKQSSAGRGASSKRQKTELIAGTTTPSATHARKGLNRSQLSIHHLPSAAATPPSQRTGGSSTGKSASDAYYFMLNSAKNDAPLDHSKLPLNGYRKKPSEEECPYFGCVFCSNRGTWKPWPNGTWTVKHVRDHMERHHWKEWKVSCISLNLRNAMKYAFDMRQSGESLPKNPNIHAEWSIEGFRDRLVKWMMVDDQPNQVVNCPEFRELLLYINKELTEKDIPHDSKVSSLIGETYEDVYKKLLHDLSLSVGAISFTADGWTSPAKAPFMAVTAHYVARVNDHLELQARLVAFRKLEGAHTGKNMAHCMAEILSELGVIDKIGQFTLDNATNNDTMMQHLEKAVQTLHPAVELPENERRCRCFPHIVNIAVQTALTAITTVLEPDPLTSDVESPTDLTELLPEAATSDDEPIPEQLGVERVASYPESWRKILQNDVIARLRTLIKVCRSSPQRLESLGKTITVGREEGEWNFKPLQLLRDVKTRWSSVYLMIERYLHLHPAVDSWIKQPKQSGIRKHALEEDEVTILKEIKKFLRLFHDFQQRLSAEHTPTIHMVLPSFHQLIKNLEEAKSNQKILAHAYDVALEKLREYLQKCELNPVYLVAFILSPLTKTRYLRLFYTPEKVEQARKHVVDRMYQAQKKRRETSTPAPISQLSESDGNAAVSWLDSFQNAFPPEPVHATLPLLPALSPECGAKERIRQDRLVLEGELKRYEDEDTVEKKYLNGTCTIFAYWESREQKFPNLFQVAMDVLPAQGSAVPCERVFSSAKRTITDDRNRLGAKGVEIRQILKYYFKSNRFSMISRWNMTSEEAFAVSISDDLGTALRMRHVEKFNQLVSEFDGI